MYSLDVRLFLPKTIPVFFGGRDAWAPVGILYYTMFGDNVRFLLMTKCSAELPFVAWIILL